MNTKLIKICVVLVVGLGVLRWLRSDGYYDFDLREVIPFMSGKASPHDWAGAGLVALGLWGWSRLRALNDPNFRSPFSDTDNEEFITDETEEAENTDEQAYQ